MPGDCARRAPPVFINGASHVPEPDDDQENAVCPGRRDAKIYDIIRDVNAARVEAGIADYPTLSYYLGLGQFSHTRLVQSDKASLAGAIGLGLRQGEDALKQKLQAARDELKRSGELDALLKKWKLV